MERERERERERELWDKYERGKKWIKEEKSACK